MSDVHKIDLREEEEAATKKLCQFYLDLTDPTPVTVEGVQAVGFKWEGARGLCFDVPNLLLQFVDIPYLRIYDHDHEMIEVKIKTLGQLRNLILGLGGAGRFSEP